MMTKTELDAQMKIIMQTRVFTSSTGVMPMIDTTATHALQKQELDIVVKEYLNSLKGK